MWWCEDDTWITGFQAKQKEEREDLGRGTRWSSCFKFCFIAPRQCPVLVSKCVCCSSISKYFSKAERGRPKADRAKRLQIFVTPFVGNFYLLLKGQFYPILLGHFTPFYRINFTPINWDFFTPNFPIFRSTFHPLLLGHFYPLLMGNFDPLLLVLFSRNGQIL